MVLEATVLCVDSSEFMRNGDVAPTRLKAQADAVNLLAGAKTQSNPESCVGVLALGGKVPKMLVTPTPDLGKVLNSIHAVHMDGHVNLAAGVQVAMLALKHRQNKNQRQRVVVFLGSPLPPDVTSSDLAKLGRKLKKNNVALDCVCFAAVGDNEERLGVLVDAACSSGNSHLVCVPPGPLTLADVLVSTPVFAGDDGGAGGAGGGTGFAAAAAAGAAAAARQLGAGAGGGGGDAMMDGVDPSLDPELALALRISLEEERARQEAAARAPHPQPAEAGAAAQQQQQQRQADTPVPAPPVADGGAAAMELDDDALLQQALAMSLAEPPSAAGAAAGAAAGGGGGGGAEGGPGAGGGGAAAGAQQPGAPAAAAAAAAAAAPPDFADDPELALALAMSLAEEEGGDVGDGAAKADGGEQ